ncbi:MAG TPA: hypothetical protein IAA54_00705 [Candidatus Gallacutalibacter pullicola]|uniref:Uncharacterized protein n=1 Tax=Candidatus Gallacutalibacter pullicola TaxID=2840830 RepID=A0A9D1J080_9FIRM|nr:hypothetical protein [Candidatus Gallacutalibacter pullicola]
MNLSASPSRDFFGLAQAERSILKYSALPSRDFMLSPNGADIFEAYSFTKIKAFRLAQAERSVLKYSASPSRDFMLSPSGADIF